MLIKVQERENLFWKKIKEQKVRKMKIEKKVESLENKQTLYHWKQRRKKAFRLCQRLML